MQNKSFSVPFAIIFASLVVGASIYFSGSQKENTDLANEASQETAGSLTVPPISAEDHILGNPNAPIVLIEYSDFDCPFCKNFHETMNKIIEEYGPQGEVAWVFRNFPLTSLHPNAAKIAEAAECVAELGGNQAYWEFTDLLFGERAVNESVDMVRLPSFAETVGVERTAFNSCYENNTYAKKVADSVDAAIAAGGQGTPHTIIMVGSEVIGTIPGAQPYDAIATNINTILLEVKGDGN